MGKYDVIVVGLGAMGSAAALELASRGARVLGLDRASIPNDQGSSHGVNRIIRLAYAEDPRYVPLLRRAYEGWRSLEARLGEPLMIITGGLDIGPEDGEQVSGALASVRTHDIEHELLEAGEIMTRFPGFELPADLVGVYQPDAGFVLSERAIAGHAALALAAGAELHGHESVLGWEADGDGVVVRSALGEYRAGRLVISAGAWVGAMVPALADVMVIERQVIGWTSLLRPEHYAVGAFPVFLLEAPEGVYYGFPQYGIPGLKLGRHHHLGQAVDPDDWDRAAVSEEDVATLRACTSRYLPGADGPLLTLKTCMYTNTPDLDFVIDRLPQTPQVVVVSPCSGHGFKFSGVVGQIAADLALEGDTDHDISMFGIDRFEGASA